MAGMVILSAYILHLRLQPFHNSRIVGAVGVTCSAMRTCSRSFAVTTSCQRICCRSTAPEGAAVYMCTTAAMHTTWPVLALVICTVWPVPAPAMCTRCPLFWQPTRTAVGVASRMAMYEALWAFSSCRDTGGQRLGHQELDLQSDS